jgi:N-acetylglucosaminyldiphosphoundecaprenol N-acetyl-beta-D-mannosaminyltransferase
MNNQKNAAGISGRYPPAVKAFGLKVHPWSMRCTLDFIEETLRRKNRAVRQVVINAAKVVNAQKDPVLKAAINGSHLVNIDGMPVVWVLRILGYRVPGRVSGIDLFKNLLQMSAEKGFRPYFLGAREKVLNRMIHKIRQQFPNMEIAGFHHGYFSSREERSLVEEIRKARPELLFIGISSPYKEVFLKRWGDKLPIPFAMGVGGSFDVLAGEIRRAPRWMQRIGLEWFFRLCQEPRRMWKRYTWNNILFIGLSAREIFRKFRTGGKSSR